MKKITIDGLHQEVSDELFDSLKKILHNKRKIKQEIKKLNSDNDEISNLIDAFKNCTNTIKNDILQFNKIVKKLNNSHLTTDEGHKLLTEIYQYTMCCFMREFWSDR